MIIKAGSECANHARKVFLNGAPLLYVAELDTDTGEMFFMVEDENRPGFVKNVAGALLFERVKVDPKGLKIVWENDYVQTRD